MGQIVPLVRVVAKPNPFRTTEIYECFVPVGGTLQDIIGGRYDDVHATVGGVPVPSQLWNKVRPKAGCEIVFVRAPKLPIAPILAAIAAGAAAASASTVVAGLVGLALTVAVNIAVSVGISMALSMAVNALVSPQQPKQSSDASGGYGRYFAITGGTNQRRLFDVLPKLYGQYRITPPLAANLYTEISGNDQYLHMLLCLNYGPLSIGGNVVGYGYNKITNSTGIGGDVIRIGETSLSDFTDVQWEIGTIDQITLFTNDVEEQQFNVDLKLISTTGENGWYTDNVSAVRTTTPNTSEISVDIVFPNLIAYNKEGKKRDVQVEFKIESKLNSASTYKVIGTYIITESTKNPVRRTYRWTESTAGQYDVKVTRTRTYVQDRDTILADGAWIALRSVKKTRPWNEPRSTLMALRIKSTGQLNGTIDGISVLATGVTNDYTDTGVFIQAAANRNPAWAYIDALTREQCEFPVANSQIDWATISTWAAWCDTNQIYYDWYHLESETLIDRIRAIASAGFASWALVDTKFSVVTDLNTSPIQMITPKNARNFAMEKGYAKFPHAVKVSYVDPNKWEQAERIVYDDGYSVANATRFEKIDTQGCTNQALARKHGRYFLSALRLRPEIYTVEMDVEALVATRGDVVTLGYDSILVGLAYGRIKAKTGTPAISIDVDELCYMEAGKTYAVRIRRASLSGSQILRTINTVPGYNSTLTFTSTVADLSIGDLFTFGENGSETLLAKVQNIDYNADFSATVKLIPAATNVFDAWTGQIDDFDPQLNTPVTKARPQAPRIIAVTANSDTLHLNDDGTYSYEVTVQFAIRSGSLPLNLVEVWYSYKNSVHVKRVNPDVGYVILENIPPSTPVQVKMRARSIWNVWGNYSAIWNTNTAAKPTQPGAVDRFFIEVIGTQARLTWNAVTFANLSHYQVRFTTTIGASANWDLASILVDRVPINTTTVTVPALVGTYLIKAFDSNGKSSRLATAITSTIAAINNLNAIATVTESPGFTGVRTGTVKSGSTLILDSQGVMADWVTLSSVLDLGHGYITEGYYTFGTSTDLSQVYTSRVTSNTVVYGESGSNFMSDWETLLSVDRLDGTDPGTWYSEMQIRTSNDAPGAGATWSAWQKFYVGDYTARQLQFRIYLQALIQNVTPVVSVLSVDIDMEDRVAYGNDIVSSAGGSNISFIPAFAATPAIGISAQAMSLSDFYVLSAKSRTGFTIQFKNSAGTGVSKTFDWLARGYGYQV